MPHQGGGEEGEGVEPHLQEWEGEEEEGGEGHLHQAGGEGEGEEGAEDHWIVVRRPLPSVLGLKQGNSS